MDIYQAVIFSIVEGVTEFLPISSTGHLILTAQILNIPQSNFVKSFEIFIQLGAILSVINLYRQDLLTKLNLWKKILVAFLPTAAVGLIFYQLIKDLLIGNLLITILAIFLGGLVLIFLELIYKEKDHHASSFGDLSLTQALGIGLIQSLSVIPGVSRAGASIMGGLFLGAKRKLAVEFSFLLAIPTMFAATGLDLIKMQFNFSPSEWTVLIVGFVGAFICAHLVIKWFLKYVQKNNFIIFGVYRLILSVIFWYFFIN